MSNEKLIIQDIDQNYMQDGKSLPVLRNINMEEDKGEFICIVGPSGCGKSTLFNILAGLEEPLQGKVILDGQDITGQRGHIGYMPQNDLLFPWRDLMGNILLAAEVIEDISTEVARKRARELMPLFGLEGFEKAMPSELSGGMKQRAALMRTVLTQKDVLALDEPFGALDAITRKQMQNWLLEIWSSLNLTVLFVTHDIEEALVMADRIYVLSQRPGRIIEKIEVNLQRPRSDLEQDFINLKSHLLEIFHSA